MFRQTIFIILGVALYFFLGAWLRSLERVKSSRFIAAAAALGLLAVNVVFSEAVFGAKNWLSIAGVSFQPSELVKVLYIYTGAATLACMEAGATVTHVDASKGMVQWARENAAASNLAERPVRWLVDDCVKFVQREIRRGNHYDGIIMDPPSYGRGPGGEVWKLEEQLYGLVEMCVPVLTDNPLFFILNSYTTGLSPSVMAYLLGVLLRPKFGGYVSADEIGLPVTETGLVLPCGSTAIWSGEPV